MYFEEKETKIGLYLKGRRKSLGLTKSQLAEKANTTYHSIYFMESGRRPPGISVFLRLMDALELVPDEMIIASGLCPSEGYSEAEVQSFRALIRILVRAKAFHLKVAKVVLDVPEIVKNDKIRTGNN